MCSRPDSHHLRAHRVCRAETWPGACHTRTPFFCLQPRTTLTCKAAHARSAGSGVRLPFLGGGAAEKEERDDCALGSPTAFRCVSGS